MSNKDHFLNCMYILQCTLYPIVDMNENDIVLYHETKSFTLQFKF